MLEPKLTLDTTAFVQLLRWFPKVAHEEFLDALRHAKAHFFSHFFKDAGSRLAITRRKGLINRIYGKVVDRGGVEGLKLRIGSINDVAKAHEYGATITARKARFL